MTDETFFATILKVSDLLEQVWIKPDVAVKQLNGKYSKAQMKLPYWRVALAIDLKRLYAGQRVCLTGHYFKAQNVESPVFDLRCIFIEAVEA